MFTLGLVCSKLCSWMVVNSPKRSGSCIQRTKQLVCSWFRGAAAAVIVYDITNAESFQKAKNWVKELQRQGSPNLVIAIAGNKADLADSRAVPVEEAQVGSMNFIEFVLCHLCFPV